MLKSIVPLAEVPRPRVEEYLRANTSYFRKRDEAAVAWKYYDDAFNRGRPRGYAWFRNDKVGGFIGIVPALVAKGGEVRAMHWTCDWGLADPKATPGMGVMLLRKAISELENVATAGGNENTRTLAPRIARSSIEDAGMFFWRPLRLASLFHLASSKYSQLGITQGGVVGKIPLPWRLGRKHASVVATSDIAPQLDRLFENLRPAAWTAHYDVPHLQWAVERCPRVECGSCYVDSDRGPIAGSVYWYVENAPSRHVRFAAWATEDAGDALGAVIAETIRQARARGGDMISVLADRRDARMIELLRRFRFFTRSGVVPLYSFSPLVDSLGGLNYFATDLAQRFRGTA